MYRSNHISRRERERKELRLRILETARSLFSQGGEESVTLRRVAELIEFSTTAIYSHFPNKEALVREICAMEFAIYDQLLQRASQVPDAMDRLRRVATSYIDFGLQHPQHYRLLFMRESNERPATTAASGSSTAANQKHPVSTGPEPQDLSRAEKAAGPDSHLHEAMFKAMAAGCLKPEYRDVELLTQTVWGCLHGIVTLHMVRAQQPQVAWRPIQNLVEFSLESLLNGMTVPSCQIPPTWRR